MEVSNSKSESKNGKLELVHEALQQLLEERRQQGRSKEEEEDDLLSKLLSQLESLEKDNAVAEMVESSAIQQEEQDDGECGPKKQVDMDDIARDLKRIKRQNLITHCLLSVMIVVTAVWQFQEASFLLAAKQKLSHPVRAVGDMVKGALIRKAKKAQSALPPRLQRPVPELHHVPLPSLTLDNGDEA